MPILGILALLFCFSMPRLGWATQTVAYPNIDGLATQSIGYRVLELALKKSRKDFRVILADAPAANGIRAQLLLKAGTVDVIDLGYDSKLEDEFEPIYLPLDRGMLGWRIFLIRSEDQAEYSKVQNLASLRNKVAGQGTGWSDVKILESAGLEVRTASVIDSVMGMLHTKRIDFFPLGANEAYALLAKFERTPGALAVEQRLTLIYPFGRFFYLRKGNDALKAAIETGMVLALADDSLQKLLESHPMFKDAFGRAKLKHRQIIHIENPDANAAFKKIDAKWWLDASRL